EVLRAGMPTECTRIEEGYLVEALEVCPDQLGDAVTQVCELLVAAIQEGEYTDALDRRCCRDLAVGRDGDPVHDEGEAQHAQGRRCDDARPQPASHAHTVRLASCTGAGRRGCHAAACR